MFTLNCNGRLLEARQPIVMGIINTTPDSFYARSRVAPANVLEQAEQMLEQGAVILDIGGQSTRPGSTRVPEDEELRRVIPVIRNIRERFPDAFLSVDTFYSRVAREAVAAGAGLINDVSGGTIDPLITQVAIEQHVPYVLMHMKGEPSTMHLDPQYPDVTMEVLDYLIRKTERLKKAGLHDIIIDPGFGFGKTILHNFELLRNLDVFKMIERPLMIGVSRKSTIFKTLGVTADEALNGTTVLHTIALMKGAGILRVHDVKEATEAVKLVMALNGT